ncbi:MAG TPA: DNA/RNA non-specific endonuclease [Thermoanaerobaculia bacterium]|jgi:hypothetical protein
MAPPIAYTTANVTLGFPNVKAVTANVVTSAKATLRSNNMTGGSGASGSINPPGWGGGICPIHHNRGHLIGNNLGGPGNVANNLVTLVAGTNHPIMYDYEYMVRDFVLNNSGREPFEYLVECTYGTTDYTLTPGFTVPGAAGNPFCLFPAPAVLLLSLKDTNGTSITINNLVGGSWNQQRLSQFYTHMMVGEKLKVLNGVFKEYSGHTHYTNNCWSVTHDATVLATGATNYATGLGY